MSQMKVHTLLQDQVHMLLSWSCGSVQSFRWSIPYWYIFWGKLYVYIAHSFMRHWYWMVQTIGLFFLIRGAFKSNRDFWVY